MCLLRSALVYIINAIVNEKDKIRPTESTCIFPLARIVADLFSKLHGRRRFLPSFVSIIVLVRMPAFFTVDMRFDFERRLNQIAQFLGLWFPR